MPTSTPNPISIRAAASINSDPKHKAELEAHALKCSSVGSDLSAASYAARAARAASDVARAKDQVLTVMAECGVEALKLCKSQGCEWLDLIQD